MLLYTRRAPPKEPKRRSRAGCAYCKEKKKKCDENRPKCSRCVEHGTECVYEAVKPRQRKRREPSSAGSAFGDYPADYPLGRRLSDVSYLSSDFFGEQDESDGEEAALELAGSSRDGAIVSRSRPLRPDLAMITPCPVGSPLLDFCPPRFVEFSDRPNRRALVDHFCNILSHLIVFREESGNPFQQLVLPLTQKSSAVMNAIYALASAHLEYRGVENAEKSIYFHNQAIQGLGRLIEQNNKSSRNEILAAIMLLVYYEVLVQKGHSNIVAGHLKGALTVMCTNPEPSDPTSVFLERAFRFYDVIAALSNGTAPLSAAPAPGCLQPFPPLGAPVASPLCNVDTLLGMATTLWPIIHRLSDLLSLKNELEDAVRANAAASKIAVLRTEFESATGAIETALAQWQPHLPPGFVPDKDTVPTASADNILTPENDNNNALDLGKDPATPTTPASPTTTAERARLHSTLHNALAYRHSAFVYLYRTIYGYARSHSAVQTHAHLALTHCVATTAHAGPMGALLWPLFAASCEAVSAEDRKLAEQAFTAIRKRQGMTNIERAWEIVTEVWRRADWKLVVEGLGGSDDGEENKEQDGGDLWREVSREMGVSIVFG